MCCQTIDLETQVRKYVIVDDVIEEYGIRIEGLFRQNYAIIKRFGLAANGYYPIGLWDYCSAHNCPPL